MGGGEIWASHSSQKCVTTNWLCAQIEENITKNHPPPKLIFMLIRPFNAYQCPSTFAYLSFLCCSGIFFISAPKMLQFVLISVKKMKSIYLGMTSGVLTPDKTMECPFQIYQFYIFRDKISLPKRSLNCPHILLGTFFSSSL